jgi:tyrosine-protein kinase Etk/Wzc
MLAVAWSDPGSASLITKLDGYLIHERTELLKTYNYNSQPVQDINRAILQIKNTALSKFKRYLPLT